jgi:hypothetical protein
MHFSPDPFSGARWPFAAIVERDGAIEIARSGRLPGPDCLGSEKAAGLLLWMFEHLAQVRSFDRPPPAFGTSVVLDRAISLPAAVTEPVRWVEEHVLPRAGGASKATKPRSERLASAGLRFFEAEGVGQWVRKGFDPARHWPGTAPRGVSGLKPVNHFTTGGGEVLLMEPVLPLRVHSARDLQDVITKMQAYRGAIGRAHAAGQYMQTVFYILADNNADRREMVQSCLADVVDRVVDTNAVGDREVFLTDIQRIGRIGAEELPIDRVGGALH